MPDVVITGASRGIGAAFARALAVRSVGRLWLIARSQRELDHVAKACRTLGAEVEVMVGDLGSIRGARQLGERLTNRLDGGSTLVHNAGVWPSRLELGEDELERAFVVNHLGPWVMQAPLVAAGSLDRVMAVSAGLLVKGRFDPERTPTGEDFSGFRTYCTTKLCFAAATRHLARTHPDLDVVVLHPGVVRTDLGERDGVLGWLLERVKRRWEQPATCAERLATLVEEDRWSAHGEAAWRVEDEEQPWPAIVTPELESAVMTRTDELLART